MEPTTNDINRDPRWVPHVEVAFSAETVQKLQEIGQKVEVVEDGVMFGGYQAIYRDPASGTYVGATEMRKDGQAAGY